MSLPLISLTPPGPTAQRRTILARRIRGLSPKPASEES